MFTKEISGMMLKAFKITLGLVVTLAVGCYAICFTYLVARAVLLCYHLIQP